MKKAYQVTILRPAGNDTALVKGIVPKNNRRDINQLIMERFPNTEQVGFYKIDSKKNFYRLEMAGGEFCGNALRSFAYLALGGKKGQLKIKVSGTQQPLLAGVISKNKSYAQMPIYTKFASVQKINKSLSKVELSGITHLIAPLPKSMSAESLKKLGKALLEDQDLVSSAPAAGVMFWSKQKKRLKLSPVVWVRDIKTLFYETACASGTTALGLYLSQNVKSSKNQFKIEQPSGQSLLVKIEKDKKGFKNASIFGPIQILKKVIFYA